MTLATLYDVLTNLIAEIVFALGCLGAMKLWGRAKKNKIKKNKTAHDQDQPLDQQPS